MNCQDFQSLALERLEDAQALMRAGRHSGAYYLAGYVVECALKACIARQTNQGDFPPKDTQNYYTHNVVKLRDVIEKSPALKSQWEADQSSDLELATNWALVKDWKEEVRYEPGGKTLQQAEELLSAISDSQHGVVQWLKRYW